MIRLQNQIRLAAIRRLRPVRTVIVTGFLSLVILNGGMISSIHAQCNNQVNFLPDGTFDLDGMVTTDIGNQTADEAHDIVVQPDGKLVVAGEAGASEWNFAVVRYLANGSLDQTFASGGIARVDFADRVDLASGVALQSNGKIVVVGSTCVLNDNSTCNFALTRLNPNGTRDLTFGGFGQLGRVTTDFGGDLDEARKVNLQTDGRIVVVGRSLTSNGMVFAVARYNSDGTLDASFGGDGRATFAVGSFADAYDLAIQPDGKIIVVGGGEGNFRAIRINLNGTIDSSFGPRGKVSIDFSGKLDIASSVAIQSDGKIVIGGAAQPAVGNFFEAALVRLNANGTLDSSFDGDGRFTQDFTPGNDSITDLEVESTFGTVTFVANSDSPGTYILAAYYPSSIFPGCVATFSTLANDNRQVFGLAVHGSKIYVAGYHFVPFDFFVAAFETNFPM
ncbi:MAG: delta-60 repeat domain-containing protein [Pyrinomonadaceae bacterium]